MMKTLPTNSPINKYRITTGQMATKPEDIGFGMFIIPHGKKVLVISTSDGLDDDGNIYIPWEHVSVHGRYTRRNKKIKVTPTWEDMCFVKDLFWDKDEVVVQYHPAEEDYVNVHEHCLHLWKPIQAEMPTPPKICV